MCSGEGIIAIQVYSDTSLSIQVYSDTSLSIQVYSDTSLAIQVQSFILVYEIICIISYIIIEYIFNLHIK